MEYLGTRVIRPLGPSGPEKIFNDKFRDYHYVRMISQICGIDDGRLSTADITHKLDKMRKCVVFGEFICNR